MPNKIPQRDEQNLDVKSDPSGPSLALVLANLTKVTLHIVFLARAKPPPHNHKKSNLLGHGMYHMFDILNLLALQTPFFSCLVYIAQATCFAKATTRDPSHFVKQVQGIYIYIYIYTSLSSTFFTLCTNYTMSS